jgi:hypothetical protein
MLPDQVSLAGITPEVVMAEADCAAVNNATPQAARPSGVFIFSILILLVARVLGSFSNLCSWL